MKIAALFAISSMLCADEGLPNISSRPEMQPRTIDMSIEALYWYTSENVDWAFTLHSQGLSTQTNYKAFNFRWAPGFRIGLGYNMEHDEWDTQASYSWFQSSASGSSEGPITPGFFSARLSLAEPFSVGKASINLHYNMFDWDLGRSFFVSSHLLLRPSIGMKAGWITQLIHSYWEHFDFIGSSTLYARENLYQSFKGGGPKGALCSKWYLGSAKSFSLISAFETGYLWGHWSIKDVYIDSLATVIPTKTTARSFASFMLHGSLGLSWETNFDRDRSHFAFKLVYEIEDWFNQCQFFTDINGAQNNDLILQGLSASLRFDF